jgi:hypothetical protein
MNLIDFFNSAELELPGSWDTYPGSFEQFIAEIFAKYQTNLSALSGTDYLTERVCNESAVATSLCVGLNTCFEEYLLGHPPKAYGTLAQLLRSIEPAFKAMYTVNNVAGALTHIYRIRSDRRSTLSPKEVFHVPFESRHLVATFRYSIPGLPCLYLGGSAYVCWEECGRPALDSVHLSRFQPASTCTLHLLDFGWRPAQMAALIDSGQYRSQLSGPSAVSDLVVAHALCWPLLAACSIKVRHPAANFKPEYIIPQLVLQWLTNETQIDGVRYFTTKASRYFNDPMTVANFAFPVRTTKPSGYCDHLASRFELSNPVCWPTVGPTAPAVGSAPHTNFTINTPTTHFNQTELGRLQHCAAALPCNSI